MTSQAGIRSLSPGRVVVVANKTFRNSLAIILQQSSLRQQTSLSKDPLDKLFTVLILTSKQTKADEGNKDLKPTAQDVMTEPRVTRKLLTPDGMGTQVVQEIRGSDISFITTKQIKTDPARVIDDHKKREIPRFR